MTIQQLTYLLEVYKAGSFSVAAKNLFITQSAISNAVIALEKEIDSPIFIRSKKGLVPTNRNPEHRPDSILPREVALQGQKSQLLASFYTR